MTTLRTARLVLGPHREDDLERLNRWENDREILEMISDDMAPTSLEESRTELARWATPEQTETRFAIRTADDGSFVGFMHLGMYEPALGRCRLGYAIGEKALWGRGLATEAARAVVTHAFGTLGVRRIGAGVYATNPASIRVLEKVGFRREGALRANVRRGDAFVDEILFGLLSSEWPPVRG